NGVQLWVALPDVERNGPASFQHIVEVPILEQTGGIVRVFAGSVGDYSSTAMHFSPLLGVDISLHAGGSVELPLDRSFEHAALLLSGDAEIDGQPIDSTSLWYLGTSLIGGLPFPEKILMWWNFVARTPEEIADARSDWQSHQRFAEVTAYNGPRIDAPPLQRFAQP